MQTTDKDAEYLEWRASERLADLDRRMDEAMPAKGASSLAELYALDGKHFIVTAFHTFLYRAPSEDELAAYLRLLHGGTAKSSIACSLRYCQEAGRYSQHLDLRRERLLQRLTRLPLIGKSFLWLQALLGVHNSKQALLAQQQEIARLRALVDARSQGLYRDLIAEQEAQRRALRDEIQALRAVINEQHVQAGSVQAGTEGNGGGALDDSFYIAFENHFRGSEAEIRARLAFYLPLISEHLSADLKTSLMVDIGCGRGEWLGLLTEAGYRATGIDLNHSNVAACRGQSLDAVLGDGIAWLRQQESQSIGLLSAFHVIEHLPLAQLNALLVEALRCLKPGGMLILETPNPENLVTAAHRFYTDPTHRNPIPPDLTEFLLRHKGFKDVFIHRLHPTEDAIEETSETARRLNALLYGPQDYAAIAIKA